MDPSILTWLLEEENPEVQLRTLKEYEKLPDNDERIVACKKRLLQSKIYERGLKKLRTDKPWAKYDAILGFAEWGLTRADLGGDIDSEVFALIESTGFKMLCGEPLLLRNLVKLGYGQEEIVKKEIDLVLGLIQEDGGFRCISTNKKLNDPRKPHKSCARLTVEYLLFLSRCGPGISSLTSACEPGPRSGASPRMKPSVPTSNTISGSAKTGASISCLSTRKPRRRRKPRKESSPS